MKSTTLAALIGSAFVTLSACDMPGSDQPSVVDALLDKSLTTDNGAMLVIQSGGTMSGTIRGEQVVGEYTANATEICSTYSAPDFLTGREFCSVPEITGNTVVFQRRDGSTSPVYTIGG